MQDNKKIKYNFLLGIISQIVIIVLGILVPRMTLTSYGSEINGLLSSVTNIYSYIAIVEAGVAAASIQALYKPCASKEYLRINQILSATNKYYHKTGMIYLGLIILFSVGYPVVIQSEIPYWIIAMIIMLNGIGNVINYFFYGKYIILLKADGRNYVRILLETLSIGLKQLLKIVLMARGFDVIFVQFIALLVNFTYMISIYVYIKKNFGWLNLNERADFEAISQRKNVLVHEINYLITSNVDIALLSLFTSLKVVSVYSMYNLLFNMVTNALQTIKDSIEFKIAKEFNKDRERFMKIYSIYEVCYITLAFALFTIACFFIHPFLRLYTSGVSDVEYIDPYLPFLFIAIQLLTAGRYPSDAMVHIAGKFRETQKSAMIETVINVGVSIVLVSIWGIYGVLMGTIVSSLFRTNYLIIYINRNILFRNCRATYKCWLTNLGSCLFILFINRFLQVQFKSYIGIFAFCIPYSLGVMSIYLITMFFFENSIFKSVWNIVKAYLSQFWKRGENEKSIN